MRRRRYLSLAAAGAAGLTGCTARALPDALSGAPGPSDGCPSVLDVDRRVCPGDDGPLSIEQSSETVTGDAWSLVVTVTNESAEPLGANPYAWSVYRRDGSRWRHVAPNASNEPWLELRPDERYVWQLTAAAGGLADADQRVYLALDPGTYAFAVPFRADGRIGATITFDVSG